MNDAELPVAGASGRRRLWLLLALPGALGPLLVFGFILFSESAHDEARCPYELVVERPVAKAGGARVREERRRCLSNAEERRFTLVRGAREQLLGRRRFAPDVFADPGYGWDAGVSDAGEVRVLVHSPGHESVRFREGRADER